MPKWYGGSTLNCSDIVRPEDQWRDQWNRAERWYVRVQEIKRKSDIQDLNHNDLDSVIAFFQNCYHVRDWISASRPQLKNDLNKFFQVNFEMGACRDICNGFKHKELNHPTHDGDFNLYREYDHLMITGFEKSSPVKYCVVFADGLSVRKFDLFELADSCHGLWNQFLQTNGLGNPEFYA